MNQRVIWYNLQRLWEDWPDVFDWLSQPDREETNVEIPADFRGTLKKHNLLDSVGEVPTETIWVAISCGEVRDPDGRPGWIFPKELPPFLDKERRAAYLD